MFGNVGLKALLFYLDNAKKLAKEFKFDQKLLENMSLIRMVVNGSTLMKSKEFREVCQETYVILKRDFSWQRIPVSYHRVLCHAVELQELLGDTPIGNVTEEPAEHVNKFLKYNLVHHTYKGTAEDVCKGLHRWQLLCSDPLLQSLVLERKRRNRKEVSYPEAYKRLVHWQTTPANNSSSSTDQNQSLTPTRPLPINPTQPSLPNTETPPVESTEMAD